MSKDIKKQWDIEGSIHITFEDEPVALVRKSTDWTDPNEYASEIPEFNHQAFYETMQEAIEATEKEVMRYYLGR